MSASDIKVDAAVHVKGEGTLEMSYHVYPITLTLPGIGHDMRFSRRYSDFAALRSQLVASYWSCIVPPIPAKESIQDKISSTMLMSSAHAREETEQSLLEYRRIALRRFLQRVAFHPVLGKSPLLVKFTNDNEWRQCLREPVKAPAFLSTSSLAEGIVKSLHGSGGGNSNSIRDVAQAFSRALVGDRPDAATWVATASYIQELQANLRALRDRFQGLVSRRRATGEALLDFGEAFGSLGDEEEDNTLQQAMHAVRERSTALSDVYAKQADKESTKVVSTLGYYVGMCAATVETLRHVQAFMQEVEALGRRSSELEASIPRAAPANRDAMQNNLRNLTDTKQRMEQQLTEGEGTFKEEFKMFHSNKQRDMKELLKVFGDIELQYATTMNKEWEMLRPMIDSLAH